MWDWGPSYLLTLDTRHHGRSMNHQHPHHHRQDRTCLGTECLGIARCLNDYDYLSAPVTVRNPSRTDIRHPGNMLAGKAWLAQSSCFEHQTPGALQIKAVHTPSGET